MSEIIVIPNQQTPRVPNIHVDIKLFLNYNAKELQEFKDYAYSKFEAVGLAANQVSFGGYRFMARVFALKNINNVPPMWRLIIDPVITEYVGMKEIKVEGCLTWKGKRVVAERSRAVRVNYYNEVGEEICGELHTGFEGQIWQHEINHLNGIEERIEDIGFSEPKSLDIQRNDKCPCGSNLKYKKCCFLYL